MIEIIGLSEHVYVSMMSVFGDRIFEGAWPEHDSKEDEEKTFLVRLNKSAIIKFYGFDSSISVDLGAKKYIIEKNDYYKVELE